MYCRSALSRTLAVSRVALVMGIIAFAPQHGTFANAVSPDSGGSPGRRAEGDASQGKDGRDRGSSAARRVVDRARALVPASQPYELVLIDPELAADPAVVRQLDAFTVREDDGRLRPKIYINRESGIVRQAIRGDDFYVKVLAAVIAHEVAHLGGGDEAMARRAERQFFEHLVAQGHVSSVEGQRYLDLLRQRADGER